MAETPALDLPDEIYVGRDEETNEKRWYSCKGMGEKYVHARFVENWRFVAKHGLAKCTPEHTWAQWVADRNAVIEQQEAEISRLRSELEKARTAITLVRSIIKDGAMTGFNCHDGDWADRLFRSQSVTFSALNAQKTETM